MKTKTGKIRARRRRNLFAVIILLILASVCYAFYWQVYRSHWVVSHNAFVTGNLIPVEADSTGIVTQVMVEESQYVKKGDLLVRLDEHRAKTTLLQREGELGQTVRDVGALFASYQQVCQKLNARNAKLIQVRHDVNRFRQGTPNGAVSNQVLQNAEDQMAALESESLETKAELRTIQAKIGGTSKLTHPDIEAAKSRLISAYIEYVRQRIYAPITGYVANRKVQVGNRVQPSENLMTIVPLDHLWVEANLRETELEQLRPGQPANVVVDQYGESHTFHGTVEGLVPGTGSVFALLPPDNATGNFIHIVERVPVRIALVKDEILRHPLRPGLSTVTSINVMDMNGKPTDSLINVSSQEYRTDIFVDELKSAESMAEKIIKENIEPKTDLQDRNYLASLLNCH